MNAAETEDELILIRRHLHSHPELSLQEFETADYISQQLADWGIPFERVGETGVVATISGAKVGPTLGYRADTDALPIEELSTSNYASTNRGVMHACGHDVHTTIGLGIAKRTFENRGEYPGTLRVIFQPAEEASPVDTPIGAEAMVQDGVLDPPIDAMFALHCMPTLEVGKIGYTGGSVWASSNLVEIEIRGEKTHAAYPHEGIDAALVASHVLVALQSVTSRRVDTRQPTVLTIGHMVAGNTYNVLAETAQMSGILRSLSREGEEVAKREVSRIVEGVASAHGATGVVKFTTGARLVENDPRVESTAIGLLKSELGEDAVVPHLPQLGAEDFSAFSSRVPSCYLFLGVRNESKGITHMIHTPYFDVDEACIGLAVSSMTSVLFRFAESETV